MIFLYLPLCQKLAAIYKALLHKMDSTVSKEEFIEPLNTLKYTK